MVSVWCVCGLCVWFFYTWSQWLEIQTCVTIVAALQIYLQKLSWQSWKRVPALILAEVTLHYRKLQWCKKQLTSVSYVHVEKAAFWILLYLCIFTLWYICVLEHFRIWDKISLQNKCFESLTPSYPLPVLSYVKYFWAFFFSHKFFSLRSSQFIKGFTPSHIKISTKFLMALVKTCSLLSFKWMLYQFFRISIFRNRHISPSKKNWPLSQYQKTNLT